MKTTTYLRYSLLIPFFVWAISLLMLLISVVPTEIFRSELMENISFGLSFFFGFYSIGIFIWIFPYVLVALILFLSTFIMRTRMALTIFSLSPIAMTLLTLSVVILFVLGGPDPGWALSNLGGIDQAFMIFNVLIVAISLIWGYICVAIGFGIYKLLQHSGFISDEAPAPALLAAREPW